MSERHKPHNGRDSVGKFRVKQVDLDDVQTDPEGTDFVRDDVRQGGAVADTGALATATIPATDEILTNRSKPSQAMA